MGRPPKAPEKGKRQNYTFRMSDADRDKLVEAAEANGRSMSEEIERRVEESFKQTDIIKAASEAAAAAATIAATEAATHLISNWAGEKKYFNIGLAFASTIRHAMVSNGLGNSEISDIHKHPYEMKWIKDYLIKCIDNWFETPGMSLDYTRFGRKIGENLIAGRYADDEIGKKTVSE
jgi:hypothetical protein